MEYLVGLLFISWPLASIFIVRHHLKIAKNIAPDPKYHKYLLSNILQGPSFLSEELPFPHEKKHAEELIRNRSIMIGKIILYFVFVSVVSAFLKS
jgi:hypothetical protein